MKKLAGLALALTLFGCDTTIDRDRMAKLRNDEEDYQRRQAINQAWFEADIQARQERLRKEGGR